MKYLLCNFYLTNDPLGEQAFTNGLLKDAAYNAKIKSNITKNVSFIYVLVPKVDYVSQPETLLLTYNSAHSGQQHQLIDIESIYTFLNGYSGKFSFDIVNEISDTDLSIFYSDGSSSKAGQAAYATVFLKELAAEGQENSYFDIVTNSSYLVENYSELIDNGTNNIGELSGVQCAVKLATPKLIQVIVSDSEYSLKCFREWIYNWKTNGYKGSSKKTILNCDLIKSIQQDIEDSKKIYLFKWTKGHADTSINELCDRTAKSILGIK